MVTVDEAVTSHTLTILNYKGQVSRPDYNSRLIVEAIRAGLKNAFGDRIRELP